MNWTVFWLVLLGAPVAALLAYGAFWLAISLWWALGETTRERLTRAAVIVGYFLLLVGTAAAWGALWDEAGVP